MNEKPESKKPIDLDEMILDRLVDNDLSDNEYREVLRLVEDKPDGWRKLALAFLESQAFEKELSALHDDVAQDDFSQNTLLVDDPFHPESESETHRPFQENRQAAKEEIGKTGSTTSSHQQKVGFWLSLRKAMPAIAACFAIAFAIGLYVREMQMNNTKLTADTNQHVGGDQGGQVDPEFIELVSNDPNGRVQTPVYNHTKFDPGSYARDVDTLKPKLQEVVQRSGWNANERTHVVPIKDRTGNKIIVPLKEIKLTPSKFEDYQ